MKTYKLVIATLTGLIFAAAILILSLPTSAGPSLRVFTLTELSFYDGSDPYLPVYVAYGSYVYDATINREYYAPKGPYHHLAGTVVPTSPNPFYPVVGILR